MDRFSVDFVNDAVGFKEAFSKGGDAELGKLSDDPASARKGFEALKNFFDFPEDMTGTFRTVMLSDVEYDFLKILNGPGRKDDVHLRRALCAGG